MTEKEILMRKAAKLYHMAWSGVTKYLKTVCQVKQKPIEFPGFAIFLPVCVRQAEEDSQRLT